MTDPVTTTVVSDVKADAAKVETAVKADVTTVESSVSSFWTKVKPWLTHAIAAVGGYIVANVGVVEALIKKL
jgi:hypothetical protein